MARSNWSAWLAAIHDHQSFGVAKMMPFCRLAALHLRTYNQLEYCHCLPLQLIKFGFDFSGNILTLNEVKQEDRGIYYCIADNGVGTDRRSANFDVEFPPQISVPRPKVAQALDYDIELECRVQGYPAPSVTWYRDDQELHNSGGYTWVKIIIRFENKNIWLTYNEHFFAQDHQHSRNQSGHLFSASHRLDRLGPIRRLHLQGEQQIRHSPAQTECVW